MPPPQRVNLIRCKGGFILSVKLMVLLTVKADVVRKGCNQQEGIAYTEYLTALSNQPYYFIDCYFTLLVTSYLMLVTMFFVFSMKVFIQPPGFVMGNRPSFVFKLYEPFYCLKQAPYTWFQNLSSSSWLKSRLLAVLLLERL